MLKIISVMNMKGGVGKTTLTANLAGALAAYHQKKVLIVDVDMQANLSQYFMEPQVYAAWVKKESPFKTKQTVMAIYQKRALASTASVRKKAMTTQPLSLSNLTYRVFEQGEAHVDLIPSTLELVDLDSTNADNRLKVFLNTVKAKYDLILIDCPPTMYFFTKSALIASDSYLIPVKPDHLSSFGFLLLEKLISQLESDFEKELIQIGTIFTLVKGTNLMRDTMINMKQLPKRYFFENSLGDYTNIAEAAGLNKLIFQYPKASGHIQALQDITDEFVQRINSLS